MLGGKTVLCNNIMFLILFLSLSFVFFLSMFIYYFVIEYGWLFCFNCFQHIQYNSEVGKAQLEAQSAISAIAEVALRFNFLFWNIAEVALQNKAFKICCALIALRFQFFFFG